MDAALTPALLANWPLPLPASGSKIARGTVLVIGGSPHTPGAVLLAGRAALRAGAGRLQLATCSGAATNLAVTMPEALVHGLPTTPQGGLVLPDAWEPLRSAVATADAVLLGSGMADLDATTAVAARVLEHVASDAIVVVDALAIAALSKIESCVDTLRDRLLLTPNAQEVDILVPDLPPDTGPHDRAIAAAKATGAVVTLYGEVAAADGRTWSGGGGGIGLGTSGSGDVLAGFAAGLGARCGDAAQAACWAAYLHGTAGERLGVRVGPVGFLARELADEAPHILADIGP